MSDFNDRLEHLLFDEEETFEVPEVYSSVQTPEPEFVETRQCAKCVGECKVH